jgi:hypothetical protein
MSLRNNLGRKVWFDLLGKCDGHSNTRNGQEADSGRKMYIKGVQLSIQATEKVMKPECY